MERNLTLDELVNFIHPIEMRTVKEIIVPDQINIEEQKKDVFKIIDDVGKGSGQTMIFAALEVSPNDFSNYYKEYRDILSKAAEDKGSVNNGDLSVRKIQEKFYQKKGISKEEARNIKTSSRLVALKKVHKDKIARMLESMTSPSPGGAGTFAGPGNIAAPKYMNIITNIMSANNPYIVEYYPANIVVTPEFIYIPMEILNLRKNEAEIVPKIGAPGENSLNRVFDILQNRDKKLEELAIAEAPLIFARICFGLGSAHKILVNQRPVIHRDLKPSNIMIDTLSEESDLANIDLYEALTDTTYWSSQERIINKLRNRKPIIPKIIDFGIAKEGAMDLTKTFSAKGTALYIPPEELLDKENPITADIYQVGIMLMEFFVYNGDRNLERFSKVLREETFTTSKTLENRTDDSKITTKFKENEFWTIWVDRERMDPEKKSDAEKLRKATIDSLIPKLEVKGNQLMTSIVQKSIAGDPKNRYQSMEELRYDILLATEHGKIAELERKAEKYKGKLNNDAMKVLNEIGQLLGHVEKLDKEKIRTDYRNGRELPDTYHKSLSQYFLEDNTWEAASSIRELYATFKSAFESLLPVIPLICKKAKQDGTGVSKKTISRPDVEAFISEADRCKEIIDFKNEKYTGIASLLGYAMKDKDAEAIEINSPIEAIFQKMFENKHEEAKNRVKEIMTFCNDYPKKEDPTKEEYAKLGDELEVVGLESDEYKKILSACQIVLTIFEHEHAADIRTEDNKNIFYQIKK